MHEDIDSHARMGGEKFARMLAMRRMDIMEHRCFCVAARPAQQRQKQLAPVVCTFRAEALPSLPPFMFAFCVANDIVSVCQLLAGSRKWWIVKLRKGGRCGNVRQGKETAEKDFWSLVLQRNRSPQEKFSTGMSNQVPQKKDEPLAES